LRIRDGYQRHLPKPKIELEVVGEIQPAVKRCQNPVRLAAEQRKVQIIDVEVQHVEIVCAFAHFVEHQHEIRGWYRGSYRQGAERQARKQ
jgi:hypothetical protein